MVDPIEAVADAIMQFEGWKPNTRSYANRNPGNLRRSPMASSTDHLGYCVFSDLLTGYAALCSDLRLKFHGGSKSGIGPDSTLAQLVAVWAPAADHNNPVRYAEFVSGFVSTALNRPVSPSTLLREISSGQGS